MSDHQLSVRTHGPRAAAVAGPSRMVERVADVAAAFRVAELPIVHVVGFYEPRGKAMLIYPDVRLAKAAWTQSPASWAAVRLRCERVGAGSGSDPVIAD